MENSNPILFIMSNEDDVNEVNAYCESNNIPLRAVIKGGNVRGYKVKGKRPGLLMIDGYLSGNGNGQHMFDEVYWCLTDVCSTMENGYTLIPINEHRNDDNKQKKSVFKRLFSRK